MFNFKVYSRNGLNEKRSFYIFTDDKIGNNEMLKLAKQEVDKKCLFGVEKIGKLRKYK